MKLSDSYANKEIPGDMDLVVTMLNINYGHNAELMKKCEALYGYSLYISKYREYNKSGNFTHSESAEEAIDYCINNNVMTKFFEERRNEVVGMLLEVTEDVIREWIEELEFINQEQAEIIEAKLKELDEQAVIISAKERELDEQAVIISAKERELDEQAVIISAKEREIEHYKKILKENGLIG